MTSEDRILEIFKITGLLEEKELESLLSNLFRQRGAYISIPLDIKEEEKQKITLNQRLSTVEDDLGKLKRHFEQYLKPEFKEESNTVFIQMMKKHEEIKQIYIKPSGNNIRYYIVYDTDRYVDLLDKIIDDEIKIEDSYSMLSFEFIHKNMDELEITNLSGIYLVYNRED